MRVAFIVDSFPELSETFILNQITGLTDLGHEVEIFAGSRSEHVKCHPDVRKYDLLDHTHCHNDKPSNRFFRVTKAITLLFGNWNRGFSAILRSLNFFKYGKETLSLTLFYKTILFLRAGEFDITHCHFGRNGLLAVTLKEIGAINSRIITTFHGSDISAYVKKYGEDVYKTLFDKGDLFLPISERWKERLVELGCELEKIIVHRMGIDINKFEFLKRDNSSRGKIRLLTVARLVEKKGIEYGIRAVAKVLRFRQDLEYNIAGDGNLRGRLEQLIGELNAGGAVKILGWQDQSEIMELIGKADIMIAPSVTGTNGDQEGIPVVLMEALASGLPVVTTKHSGIPELVRDGESGFLVPERDVDAMAEKLKHLIDHPEIWPEMGRKGRKFVEANYDIGKLNRRLVEIYERVAICK